MDGLNDLGRKAQEKIMEIPARLERIAKVMELKTKPKSFAFDVIFNREFAMD
jgi:acyl-[acyl-carrier-protein] desaturase